MRNQLNCWIASSNKVAVFKKRQIIWNEAIFFKFNELQLNMCHLINQTVSFGEGATIYLIFSKNFNR